MLNPVAILKRAHDSILERAVTFSDVDGAYTLARAIQHITRPDRDVYPKTRRGTKTRPVTRSGSRKRGV